MEMVHMSNYITFNDSIADFQTLITDTKLLTLPFFNTNKKKFSFILECKSSLDRNFDAIISHLRPTFDIYLLDRESIWKNVYKKTEEKFNTTPSPLRLNSFFLQELMHNYAKEQFITIKNYYTNTEASSISNTYSDGTNNSFTSSINKKLNPTLNSQKHYGSKSGGLATGNYGIVNKSYEEEKFHATQGHGFAAERANNLYDKLTGHDTKILGDNNAKNGADRIVDDIFIQSKYCASGSKCVNECFENNGHGNFRYMQNGKPMQIEVPSDKYDAAVQAMKEKIRRGQVDGMTNPSEAENIIRKGHFTYEQAKNIAKAGTIESLSYDAVNGVITSASAFGVTAVITFATSTWKGEDFNAALKTATHSGLAVGGTTFLTTVIASQLSKAGLNSALVGSSEAIVSIMGPKASATLINAFRESGTNIYGAAAMKSAAKLLRGNIISSGISTIALSSADITRTFQGRISGKQLFKNMTSTASTAIGGSGGWLAGAAIGSTILPVGGTIIGGIVGSVAGGTIAGNVTNKVLDSFILDDAEEMLQILNTELESLAFDYLLNQSELESIVTNLNELLNKKNKLLMDMFASSNRHTFASELLRPLIVDEVNVREHIAVPSNTAFSSTLNKLLEEYV